MDFLQQPHLLTDGWNLIEDRYFRMHELYSFPWKGEKQMLFEDNLIEAAPLGGALAVWRTNSLIVTIMSASGSEISRVKLENGIKILTLFWTYDEKLVLLTSSRSISIYNIQGEFLSDYSLDCTSIDAVSFFTNSKKTLFGIITDKNKLNVYNWPCSLLPTFYNITALTDVPNIWALLPSVKESDSIDFPVCIIAGSINSRVLLTVFSNGKCKNNDLSLSRTYDCIVEIAVSYDGKTVALLTNSNLMWIGSADLTQKHFEISLNRDSSPLSICWCGPSAILCRWNAYVILYSRNDSFLRYFLKDPLSLISEADGCRIVTTENYNFLQEIPNELRRIYLELSAPEYLLFESFREFSLRTPRTFELLERLIENVDEGVCKLIDSAGHEFDPQRQTLILKAAQLGSSFCERWNGHQFEKVCNSLKVINNMNSKKISIPMSKSQFESSTLQNHIDRLISRGLFGAAYCVAMTFNDQHCETKILTDWALSIVNNKTLSDEDAATEILTKLSKSYDVSFSHIATKAIEVRRTKLATMLIDKIISFEDQVPLLIKMNNTDQAIKQAITSGNTNLVYKVIFHLKERSSLAEFLMKIRGQSIVSGLSAKMLKYYYPENLFLYCKQEDNHKMMSCILIRRSWDESFDEKISTLKEMQKFLGSTGIISLLVDQTQKLLAAQRKIDLEKHSTNTRSSQSLPIIGLSHAKTLAQLILTEKIDKVESISRSLNIPDTRFWYICIESLARSRMSLKLKELSLCRRSSVGYLPFAEISHYYGNNDDAHYYLAKLSQEDQITYFLNIGDITEAANLACKMRNNREIGRVLEECVSPLHDHLIQQLTSIKR